MWTLVLRAVDVDCGLGVGQDALAVVLPPEQESIGARLRRLRLAGGFSQRELSSPGVSYAYISRIEAGNRRPSVRALRMLASKLQVSPEYLEYGTDLREADRREVELAEAELSLRLGDGRVSAEARFAEILAQAEAAGDGHSATRARLGLGLAAAAAERDADVVDYLEAALAAEPLAAHARPDVYVTLARAYSNLGRPERAVELLEGCLAEASERIPEDLATRVRYATYLSYALTDAGQFDQAQELLADLAQQSETDVDPYTRIRLYWSLGRLATREGQSLAGLGYFRRAVTLLEATEDTIHLARAHISCAWALTKSGRALSAGRHLELAEKLFGEQIEKADLGWLRTEQAKRAAQLKHGAEAVTLAREALAALGRSDPAEQGDAWLAIAEGQTLTGEIAAADAAFRRATELIVGRRPAADSARAFRLWGGLLREAGRLDEAAEADARAATLEDRETRAPRRQAAPQAARGQPRPNER